MNKVRNIMVIGLIAFLSSCNQANLEPVEPVLIQPVQPTHPTNPNPPQLLGMMEIVFGAVGTTHMRSEAIFHPRADLEGDLNSQALLVGNMLANGIQTKSIGKNGFFDDANANATEGTCAYTHGTRYIYSTFDIRNAGKDGKAYPRAHSNITFVAVDTDTSSNGSNAIGKLLDNQDNPLTLGAAFANCVKPTHGMFNDPIKGMSVIDNAASFQVFEGKEIPNFSTITGAQAIFPYGFVVQNKKGGRNLPANPAAGQFDGTITFAIKHPLQANAAQNPFKLSLVFEVYSDTVARVTESIEEQGTDNAQKRAQALLNAGVSNVEVMLLGASSTTLPTHIKTHRLCKVATAGNEFLLESNYCDYPDGRIYVNNVTGKEGNLGKSWNDAFLHLADALALARAGDVKEIWVAATNKIYTPSQASDAKNIVDYKGRTVTDKYRATFYVTEGIKLYGGFQGTETDASIRSALPNTVLSGDIDANDKYKANEIVTATPKSIQGINSQNIMYLNGSKERANITANTVVDGFTFTGGDAQGFPRPAGAGLYCDGSEEGSECSPRLQNLYFIGNRSKAGGNAIHLEAIRGGKTNAVLVNIAAFDNAAQVRDTTSGSGSGLSYGGALWLDCRNGGMSDMTLINATFSHNSAKQGGAIFISGQNTGSCTPKVHNSILWENYVAAGQGTGIYNDNAKLTLVNNLIQHFSNAQGVGVFKKDAATVTQQGVALESDPLFVNIADGNRDIHLQAKSPAIDKGDNSVLPDGIDSDLDGKPRAQGANIDLGAYEYQP